MSRVTREYCQRYGISAITLELQSGVVATADQVCHLQLEFAAGYRVQFKLQGQAAQVGAAVSRLEGDGSVIPATAAAATAAAATAAAATAAAGMPATARAAPLEAELEVFFKSIEGRLARIRHEEDVQNIEYLGNRFVLGGRTVFDVVADDDGKLTIEMHRGDKRQQAMLLASSLLDGLYDGSIVQQL